MNEDRNATGTAQPSRRGLFGRFARDRSGATAIEFTMLAIPFSLLIFAILESCISFTAQQIVSNAADEVSRQFRTGQLRPAPSNPVLLASKVRGLVCERLEIIVSKGCPGLAIDLRQFSTFADAANIKTKFTPSGDLDTTGFGVNPGKATTKNMLRVYYKWPVITDFMRASMSNLPGGKTLQSATAIWQNEPFQD